MSITIDEKLAEAALRAAAKAGFSNVVEGLLKAGVNANAMFGAALVLAERYGDQKTIEILKKETNIGPLTGAQKPTSRWRSAQRKKVNKKKVD